MFIWRLMHRAEIADQRRSEIVARARWFVVANRNGGYWSEPVEFSRYFRPHGHGGPVIQEFKLRSKWIPAV